MLFLAFGPKVGLILVVQKNARGTASLGLAALGGSTWTANQVETLYIKHLRGLYNIMLPVWQRNKHVELKVYTS